MAHADCNGGPSFKSECSVKADGCAPPPPPLRGCRLAAPLCRFLPPGVGVPLLVPAVMPSWVSHPLPVPGRRQGVGWWGLLPCPKVGKQVLHALRPRVSAETGCGAASCCPLAFPLVYVREGPAPRLKSSRLDLLCLAPGALEPLGCICALLLLLLRLCRRRCPSNA